MKGPSSPRGIIFRSAWERFPSWVRKLLSYVMIGAVVLWIIGLIISPLSGVAELLLYILSIIGVAGKNSGGDGCSNVSSVLWFRRR